MSWSWPEQPRRVVVTGMGVVTALGNDVASTWDGLVAGRSGVAPSWRPSTRRASACGSRPRPRASTPPSILDRKDMRRTDRYIQFALWCAHQARVQAGLPERFTDGLAARAGAIIGSGLGGVQTLFDNVLTMGDRGPDRISPFFVPMGIANVGAGQVAIATGATGPNFATVSACATGGHALGEAWETIRRGDADLMLAGGVEAAIHEATIGGFASMKALSPRNDEPGDCLAPVRQGPRRLRRGRGRRRRWCSRRSSTREARGATPLAELVGYGATADASHITLPAPGGIGAVRAARPGAREGGPRPVRGGPRQRPRHVHARGRQGRAGGDPDDPRRPRPEGGRDGQQVDAGPHAGCGRCRGGDRDDRDAAARGCVPPTINLDDPDDAAAGLDLTPDTRDAARRAGRGLELVRVRRPEHRAGLPAVGRMSEQTTVARRRGARRCAAPLAPGADPGGRPGDAVRAGPGTASTSGGRSRPRDGDLMSAPGESPGIPIPTDAGDVALLGARGPAGRRSSSRASWPSSRSSVGDTTIIVRSPAAVDRPAASAAFVPPVDVGSAQGPAPATGPASGPRRAARTAARPRRR